jgi:hypothetical protein
VSEAAREDSRREADKKIRDDTSAVTQEIKQAHDRQKGDLDILSAKLMSSMDTLGKQFGLRVERLLQSQVNALSTTDVDTSEQMILAARKELRILDTIAEDGSWPDESMNQGILTRAFKGILARTEDSPPLSYRRVIQVADISGGLQKVQSPTLLGHCRDILRLRQEGARNVSLRLAQRRFPFKVILIDNSGLILQLQEYSGKGDAFILWGELQVSTPGHNLDTPGHDLIEIFREIWNQIDDADDTRHIREDDFPNQSVN